ncbi:MAG: ISL3 family transposase [Polyangiaceae bacterium]|jgi:transposase
MPIQFVLRRLYPQPGFVFGAITPVRRHGSLVGLDVAVRARKGSRAVCSQCMKRRPLYDRGPVRRFLMVPLWALTVTFVYAMRRVDCKRCGVRVELVPWADGKSPCTHAFTWFIARWAKALSWQETARRFATSWDIVFRCIQRAVYWGLENRPLEGIHAIGVDELSWKKGQKYLTLVYQLDAGARRLLFVGKHRTAETVRDFFDILGEARSLAIQFVASDMWKAFIVVARERAKNAVHLLDRFHVAQLLSKCVDEVRRAEVRALRERGRHPVLTKTRWLLLKRLENLTANERPRLRDLLSINLRTTRAYLLKEALQPFWKYKSPTWAARFLDRWTTMAMRSRLPPFKTFATTLRKHKPLILNWFKARQLLPLGDVEGFNNTARITTRKPYGFRTYEHAEIALYHALGDLPEPDWLTHRFA